MRTIKIIVKKEDYKDSRYINHLDCAMVRAITREFPLESPFFYSVNPSRIYIKDNTGFKKELYKFSDRNLHAQYFLKESEIKDIEIELTEI